jgi:hypothetical protein
VSMWNSFTMDIYEKELQYLSVHSSWRWMPCCLSDLPQTFTNC